MIRTISTPGEALAQVGMRPCEITWFERDSGVPVSITVRYETKGDDVRFRRCKPERKALWHGFTGNGWPIAVSLP